MKLLFTLPLLFLACILSAQTVDLEDRDDSFILENSKNIQKIEIQEPFLAIRPGHCTDFQPAAFDGGISAYKQLLSKSMYEFLNSDYYTLNGDFTFTLFINETGKVANIEGAPKVQFSEVFFDDMKYVARRIKKNWKPATCDGKPVASQMQIKMKITSTVTDL